MSLRTRLTLIVAVIVAVAVVGGAYAAHVSAPSTRCATRPTSSSRSGRVNGFVHQPPGDLGGDFGGAPTDADDHHGQFFEFDAVQQTIDRDGTITNSLPGQTALPIDATDHAIAALPQSAVRTTAT